ncbi:hypothetical protein FHS61_003198 [Altererythrobacter atlanticus]|uniref:Uncharacterized protein n=1 Tax=Croceibacterium atlanticum TaxID=1267766 RepID=A0A0F7KLA1_9SPHN|nr:hypothetical protein [Croceibacterium atlanticum]AKH41338.1 hypothetical protein WYH_00274 [Croceibacterium atlanticum]MBB5734148.1 hypothetical protein [Croceibacterium atlanticum]
MTRSVTGSLARRGFLLGPALALLPFPALAQQDVTDDSVTATDVAMTPLEDLNLRKDPIPPVLLRARDNPYANPGIETCSHVRQEIGDLDAVLGEDFDTASPDQRKLSAEKVAKQVVGSFIPFRGVIREVTGANKHAYEFSKAIVAGLMRRAYLKGLGQSLGCPYPARPATEEIIRLVAAQKEAEAERTEGEEVDASTE